MVEVTHLLRIQLFTQSGLPTQTTQLLGMIKIQLLQVLAAHLHILPQQQSQLFRLRRHFEPATLLAVGGRRQTAAEYK